MVNIYLRILKEIDNLSNIDIIYFNVNLLISIKFIAAG